MSAFAEKASDADEKQKARKNITHEPVFGAQATWLTTVLNVFPRHQVWGAGPPPRRCPERGGVLGR